MISMTTTNIFPTLGLRGSITLYTLPPRPRPRPLPSSTHPRGTRWVALLATETIGAELVRRTYKFMRRAGLTATDARYAVICLLNAATIVRIDDAAR